MNKLPSLRIPLDKALDTVAPDGIATMLEECGARISVDSLNWPGQFCYRPLTVVTAAHSGNALYLDFLVRCNYLRAENFVDNTAVSDDSCVQFFVAPDPLKPDDYFSFGINCIGTMRGTHHTPDGGNELLGEDLLRQIQRYASVGRRPFKEVEGSFIWSVSVRLPLSVLGIDTPLSKETVLRGNFYKCAAQTSQPHYLSWSPVSSPEPDFHRPESFGLLTLEV